MVNEPRLYEDFESEHNSLTSPWLFFAFGGLEFDHCKRSGRSMTWNHNIIHHDTSITTQPLIICENAILQFKVSKKSVTLMFLRGSKSLWTGMF